MQDALDEWHRAAPRLQRFKIEGHSKQNVAKHVDEMAGRQIPGCAGAAKHDLALT